MGDACAPLQDGFLRHFKIDNTNLTSNCPHSSDDGIMKAWASAETAINVILGLYSLGLCKG